MFSALLNLSLEKRCGEKRIKKGKREEKREAGKRKEKEKKSVSRKENQPEKYNVH